MKSRVSLLPLALAATLLVTSFAASLHAQDTIGQVVVTNPIADFTVALGTAQTKIKLNKNFALDGVTGEVVRFSTILGNIDVEMLSADAPLNVANFLNYVNSGAYNNSFFHRSISNFIIQGGGYQVNATRDNVTNVTESAPVANEFKDSNVRGTLAAAQLGTDPNSATSEWFFNEADNSSNLDHQNGLGFTVFGRIIGNGLTVLDALQAVPVPTKDGVAGDGNGPLPSPFNEIPLIGYTGNEASNSDYIKEFVTISSVAPIPAIATQPDEAALITFTAQSSNTDVVSVAVVGKKLFLSYTPGATGSAKIKIKAKTSGNKVKSIFTVTVQ